MEYIAGRTYNLGSAAFLLVDAGYYDEAFNLIRGLSEIANLVMLAVRDPSALQEWVKSDKKERMEKFGPAKVRKRLKAFPEALIVADDDWYGELCERYTHPTPNTAPGKHGERAYVGGTFQDEGRSSALEALGLVLGTTSMAFCQFFDLRNLFDEIGKFIDDAANEADAT